MPSKGKLNKKAAKAINRIAGLVIVNALMFQEVLSQKDSRVTPLAGFVSKTNIVDSILKHWHYILNEINYYPIFNIAYNLLESISADSEIDKGLRNLINSALKVVKWRASLRHDLAGRIYHRLLEEAKYLGAYYTSIPSAVLLLKIALKPEMYNVNWSNTDSIASLKIADFACGTGTLLMATADAITDNYLSACSRSAIESDLVSLHNALMSSVIYGFDVIPSAIHLTASTLMLRMPETLSNVTNLWSASFGGRSGDLGSVELFSHESIPGVFFSLPKKVTGMGEKEENPHMPKLDLCVMNPPFTSSRRANLLFGSLSSKERSAMQKKLKKMMKLHNIQANLTAGLAAVFTALGDQYVREGGTLALVLPRSVLSGIAWVKTRNLLKQKYHLEIAIVCHEPKHWNFSESTSLSEALLILRKNDSEKAQNQNETIFVNLWKNCENVLDGLSLGDVLQKISAVGFNDKNKVTTVKVGDKKYGEAIAVNIKELKSDNWSLPISFAQTDLIRSAFYLTQNQLFIPGSKDLNKINLVKLGELGSLGFDPRDVYDAFELTNEKTIYPALWGHDSKKIISISSRPNQYLVPLLSPRVDRSITRDSSHIWSGASRLLLAQRTRINTKRLNAIVVNEKVLSDVWLPFTFSNKKLIEKKEKALALWFNSSLGLLLLLSQREETEGSYIQIKKPALMSLPVLDAETLTITQLESLSNYFDEISDKKLLPFGKIGADLIRKEIDKKLTSVLKLPDIDIIRKMLSREPVVSSIIEKLLPPNQ